MKKFKWIKKIGEAVDSRLDQWLDDLKTPDRRIARIIQELKTCRRKLKIQISKEHVEKEKLIRKFKDSNFDSTPPFLEVRRLVEQEKVEEAARLFAEILKKKSRSPYEKLLKDIQSSIMRIQALQKTLDDLNKRIAALETQYEKLVRDIRELNTEKQRLDKMEALGASAVDQAMAELHEEVRFRSDELEALKELNEILKAYDLTGNGTRNSADKEIEKLDDEIHGL